MIAGTYVKSSNVDDGQPLSHGRAQLDEFLVFFTKNDSRITKDRVGDADLLLHVIKNSDT